MKRLSGAVAQSRHARLLGAVIALGRDCLPRAGRDLCAGAPTV